MMMQGPGRVTPPVGPRPRGPSCTSSSSRNGDKTIINNIPVVIVESHHHVLEHTHHVIRRHKTIYDPCPPTGRSAVGLGAGSGGGCDDGWSMMHFDSHPDLACSSRIPARACFTPRQPIGEHCDDDEDDESDGGDNDENDNKSTAPTVTTNTGSAQNLYELLDSSSSGIAEWILPLVLAANLRRVDWIKQNFSVQLPLGRHGYHVGVVDVVDVCVVDLDCNGRHRHGPSRTSNTSTAITSFLDLTPDARIKVDWCHPYYLDDDSFVPTKQLALRQPLDLHVMELPHDDKNDGDNEKNRSTSLPQQLVNESFSSSSSSNNNNSNKPWMLDICLDYFVCCNPFLQDLEEIRPGVVEALLGVTNASIFAKAHMTHFGFGNHCDNDSNDDDVSTQYSRDLEIFRILLKEYLTVDTVEGGQRNQDIIRQLIRFYPKKTERDVSKILNNLTCSIDRDDKVLAMVLEALPNWSMPHETTSIFSPETFKDTLQLMEDAIQARTESPPFMVTIARSSVDGFTPFSLVEQLQSDVLVMLHRIFCGDTSACCNIEVNSDQEVDKPDSCRLQLVRDYGEWEGSTIP